MRICPFDRCGQEIPAEMFACRMHWYSLSGTQKKEIYACCHEWQAGTITGTELRERQQAVLDEVQKARPI